MVLGIDLGTTYSVAAFMDEENKPQVIQNNEGNRMTPSVVLFDTDNSIVVGDAAKDSSAIRPEDIVEEVKNKMGERVVVKKAGGKDYTPEMISSFILRKMVKDAEHFLGKQVDEVVITVPAYFSDAQRKATEDAAALAGVKTLGIINEPTAAALCFVSQNNIENQKILVYDLGGGTFDVTILDVKEKNRVEVMSTAGLREAGGRFFDLNIVDYVCEYMEDKHDIDLTDEDYLDEFQEVLLKAEKVKIQLSNVEKASIPLKIGRIKEKIEITREQFEDIIRDTYEKTERLMKEALRNASLKTNDIDKVLLVGGSSRIPYIVDRIEKFTGKMPSREINPAEAVAMGAVLYAESLKGNGNGTSFTDVCSHSIGVVVFNKDTQDEENQPLIRRNTKIPIEVKQNFRTMVNRQKRLELRLTEGEYKELTDVTIIGTLMIELPEHIQKNELIQLTISLDNNQLIHVHMEIPKHNFVKECQFRRDDNMTEEDIESITGMLLDMDVC